MLKDFLLNRMREPSTWRGFVMFLTAMGVALSPDQIAAIVSVGTAIVGALGVFLPDSTSK